MRTAVHLFVFVSKKKNKRRKDISINKSQMRWQWSYLAGNIAWSVFFYRSLLLLTIQPNHPDTHKQRALFAKSIDKDRLLRFVCPILYVKVCGINV